MKINILTQPLFCNYGGILQNYALQTVLSKMGHEPLTINVPVKEPFKDNTLKNTARTVRNFFLKMKGEYAYPFLNPYIFAKKEKELSFPQRSFVKKYINKVDVEAPFTREILDKYPADAWIVGSDQVWRPWCSPHIENCFFDFVDENTPKIAYAASFGIDKWEIDSGITVRVKNLAKRFKAISVRESSGVDLCKSYLQIQAIHVLDPTLLLSASEYNTLINDSEIPDDKYIASYILDNNHEKFKQILSVSRKYNLPVRSIGKMHRTGYDSIESWISTLANAEYVITDSFHGTAFSIIYNKPVMILSNSLRGNARLNSLLTTLDIKMFSDGFYRTYESSLNRINIMRTKSLVFLNEALTSI